MELFSALLILCAWNSPVPGEFPAQRPVTRSFDVFFDMRLNKRLRKQSWGWWLETLSCPSWHHCNVSYDYENEAKEFTLKYDTGGNICASPGALELQIINDTFPKDEIKFAIDSLKNNKAPGIDGTPAEIVKEELIDIIVIVFNYMIENKEFPDIWAEGLRAALFKSGSRLCVGNYRGITILGIFAKLFEIAVNNRLCFVNEAFVKKMMFIMAASKKEVEPVIIYSTLNGLVQRQLSIGSSLYLCYVEFSWAFDMIIRHILFYKIMNSGWYGNFIDTMRNLYEKTYFRIKCRGKVSSSILDTLGVNQGGIASGLLVRKYMADMSEYLGTEFAVCVNDVIVAHILWADDLILVSNTSSGLQKQLNGLHKFCSRNMMVVNELKTKVMVFGKKDDNAIIFNGILFRMQRCTNTWVISFVLLPFVQETFLKKIRDFYATKLGKPSLVFSKS